MKASVCRERDCGLTVGVVTAPLEPNGSVRTLPHKKPSGRPCMPLIVEDADVIEVDRAELRAARKRRRNAAARAEAAT